jgi:hypothetical protein
MRCLAFDFCAGLHRLDRRSGNSVDRRVGAVIPPERCAKWRARPVHRSVLTACGRTTLPRRLCPGWLAERFHGDPLVTHLDDLQPLGPAGRMEDDQVAWT